MTIKVAKTDELRAFEEFAASTHQMSVDFAMTVHERKRMRRRNPNVLLLAQAIAA